MRIVVQIPCFNEEATLPGTLQALREALGQEDDYLILVIDDGSTDGTVNVAGAAGASYVARLPRHEGLSAAFLAGLRTSLHLGADVVVNLDADNQYRATDIPKIVAPIVGGEADIVVGARDISGTDHFSPVKKLLQRLGSWTVRILSGANVPDATSGFRAFSRDAAMRLNVFNSFTYTLETIIQAGRSGLKILSVPIATNPPTRPSRLFGSLPQYVWRSALTILRAYVLYEPLRAFFVLGLVPFVLGTGLGMRYLLLITLVDPTRSHAPSLILAAIFFIFAFLLWTIGVVGDLIAINRRLLQSIETEQLRARLAGGSGLPEDLLVTLIKLDGPRNAP